MFNILFHHRLRFAIPHLKRSLTAQSNIQLGNEMKLLNDKKQYKKTLELFDKYIDNNIQTFSSTIITQALKACTQIRDIQRGSMIHQLISSRLKNDSYILASLIHLYMQCGDTVHAQLLFNTSTNKTLPIYGAMMIGYIKNNQADKAIGLFHEIKNPDAVIIILLFNACAQLGNDEALNLAKKVFRETPKSFHSNPRLLNSLFDTLIKCNDTSNAESLFLKMTKSVESYGNLMNEFNKENNPEKTLKLFHQMKLSNIQGNSVIYLILVKALSQIGDYSTSQSIIEQIPNSFLHDHHIQNALIDMWGKTGCINEAKQIFDKLPQRDQIGYTAMINSYGLNGMGIEAIELYHQMPLKFIDELAHVCVLNACSHSGLVDQARSIFTNIQMKTDKIYTTMIDCLSRASVFEEAQQLIDEFERDHSPIWPMYMALLSGARNEKNTHLSQKVYHRMKTLFPQLINPLSSAAILLANVYASSGEIEKASNIRTQLKESGVKKQVGTTWTTINGQFFKFRAHDRSHPRSSEIYSELEKISKELIEHGHEYDSSWITRPMNKNETVASVLCGHSERLAIAWNFVVNPNASRIQVTENLRICGDCHRAIKLIATIRQCEIIIRDANRIHHFYKNGQCSCNDYF